MLIAAAVAIARVRFARSIVFGVLIRARSASSRSAMRARHSEVRMIYRCSRFRRLRIPAYTPSVIASWFVILRACRPLSYRENSWPRIQSLQPPISNCSMLIRRCHFGRRLSRRAAPSWERRHRVESALILNLSLECVGRPFLGAWKMLSRAYSFIVPRSILCGHYWNRTSDLK